MRRRARIRMVQALLILAMSACLAGCGGTSASIRYYTVELPAAPDAARTAYPVALLVARVTAPTVLRDDRILYRTGANETGTYEYHRWGEPPAAMLETRLLRVLRESGRYQSVAETSSKARGDFVVRGRLYDFEEVDASTISGRVALEVELLDQKAGKVVWSHFYSHDEPANGDDVPAVVASLSRNLQRGLDEVATGLDAYFAKNSPK